MSDNSEDRSSSEARRAEHRNSPRIKVKVPVELHVPDNDIPLRCATADLSESGCYIESIFPFPIGTIFEMSLQLNETILALGTVVTCDRRWETGSSSRKCCQKTRKNCTPTLRPHSKLSELAGRRQHSSRWTNLHAAARSVPCAAVPRPSIKLGRSTSKQRTTLARDATRGTYCLRLTRREPRHPAPWERWLVPLTPHLQTAGNAGSLR